ncbi:hypothetical protein [Thiobacillus sp.]
MLYAAAFWKDAVCVQLATFQLRSRPGFGRRSRHPHHRAPALLADADVVRLAQDLSARGVKHYVIQAFRSQGCADAALVRDARRERPLASLAEDVAGLFQPAHSAASQTACALTHAAKPGQAWGFSTQG